ncbi:STAS domain-containing protein [bacterium]|nr:STAS domain-containing protein [bacterium]
MKIDAEQVRGATVLRATGRLDGTSTAEFEKTVTDALAAAGQGRVVIDMKGVEYVSSAGLRSLLLAAKRAKGGGQPFSVAALSPAVREIFEISGFGSIIPTHARVEDALGA